MSERSFAEPDSGSSTDCLVHVKAVPGAKRDSIAGVLEMPEGPRLKVRVSAPPEGGKANKAIATVLAKALGVKPGDVELISAPSNPLKTFRVRGVRAEDAARLT